MMIIKIHLMTKFTSLLIGRIREMDIQTIENIVREVAKEIDFLIFDGGSEVSSINEEVQNIVREILHDNIKPEEVQ